MDTSDAIITSSMFQIGDQLDRFQIKDHIAQGGMSSIYCAFDLVNRREVVIKIPDKSMIGDPAQFERFQREIEVTQKLDHPAILRGIYAGQYNRIPFLVTEKVNGDSLRKRIETSAPISVNETLQLVEKIAEGMLYCHQNNVFHRDLKPENILIRDDGQPVIMDFGLALTQSSHRVTYSNLTVTMGTPDYMAPEQVEGQRGDARSDIYALGIIMYEMLSGRLPFYGDSNLSLMAQRIKNDAPRLDKVNPAISPQIASIVARCLQRDPKDRYQDMQVLIDAIKQPDSVDTSILTHLTSGTSGNSFMKAGALRAGILSLVILAAIIAFALLLQYLR